MCGKGSVGGLTHPVCRQPQGLDGLTSIFSYKGIVEKAIKKLKYKFVYDLAEDLVGLFLSFCGEDQALVDFCHKEGVSLVPIPLHPRRLRWRGFNQSELLGKMIAQNLGLPFCPDLLLRVKLTRPQVELSRKEREKNVAGAFAFNRKIISAHPFRPADLLRNSRGKPPNLKGACPVSPKGFTGAHPCLSRPVGIVSRFVLLFDDVWTSGATLREAARALKRAGAKRVWGLTIAR